MDVFDRGQEYYGGWSLGDDIVLLRRDHNYRVVRDKFPFEWWMPARADECRRVSERTWDAVVRRGLFRRVEPGEAYWRLFVDNPQRPLDLRRIFGRMDNEDLYDRWCRPLTTPEPCRALRWPDDRSRWTTLHEAVYWLRRYGIEALEADLTPLRRFLIDEDVRVQESYRVMFLDVETDDRGSFSEKERNRITSVAWEGDQAGHDPQDSGFLALEEFSDWGERRLLSEFVREARKYDVLVAWNGDGFDFPMIIARCREVGVRVNWRLWHFADLLPVFRKRFLRQQVGSYSLDSIGEQVLKVRKLDWRDEFRRRHPGVQPTFYNLWLRDVELMERYNRRDVDILRRLEERTRFLSIERLQNRVAGIFANDFTVSNKIDTMLLRRGRREGVHFRTRFWTVDKGEKYVGAYVFDPDVGLHGNVGVFDFKALYPSMIQSFNISPETYVPAARRAEFEEGQLCRCPTVVTDDGVERGGATYRIDREGFVGQMFRDTTERRNEYKRAAEQRFEEVGTKDDPKYKLYDNLAYAFKSLGLSFYGEMGHSTGRYYEVEMAESITLSGQYFIRETQRMAEDLGMKVIYGDTDSVFIQLMTDDEVAGMTLDERREALHRRGTDLCEHFQTQYAELLDRCNSVPGWRTVQLEFEDAYDKIAFFAKKRYAGKMCLSKGKPGDGIEVKGLEYMRSDYTRLTRDMQYSVLEAVLRDRKTSEDVERDIVVPAFERCRDGKIGIEHLVISKSVSKDPSDYVSKPVHVRLAQRLKDTTSDFYPGVKVRYVVTSHKPSIEGVLEAEFDPDNDRYDAEYYWDRVFFPATLRVLQVLFPDREWCRYVFKHRRMRDKLLERYDRWLADYRRRADAIRRIRDNDRGFLTSDDVSHLRDVARQTKDMVSQKAAKARKREEAKKNKNKEIEDERS